MQWRQMVPEEKAKYEKMAAEDRERYQKECAVSVDIILLFIWRLLVSGLFPNYFYL